MSLCNEVSSDCPCHDTLERGACERSDFNQIGFMEFNATFNNISVISWHSVLLVEETRVPEETTDLSLSDW